MTPAEISVAFLGACHAELQSLKPGNVHIHAPGHGMTVAQFEAAAAAAAPHIADPALTVGQKIRRAIDASWAVANCNTNLGIVLLAAPLAKAAEAPNRSLRDRLAQVVISLDRNDAEDAFAAIKRASPAGLGTVPDQDVASRPDVTLRDAMALAASRDRIARAYVTDFADIFEFGLPALCEATRVAEKPELAVTTLHMLFLSAFPDSHVARKYGTERAEHVRRRAEERRAEWHPVTRPSSMDSLLAFDAELKAEGVNPGTTADLAVATLFAERLSGRTP